MRTLFDIDTKDYNIKGTITIRPSSRAIIIKNNKIYMMHSKKYRYYKFPGGGIEKGESEIDALIREVKEESGLKVIRKSIKEYGMVHRIQKGDYEDVFIQDNFYFLCDVVDGIFERHLDPYEEDEGFELVLLSPLEIINLNNKVENPKADLIMISRENKIINILMDENIIERQ
jgi:8-oxo-dGTP pyrophosphatase MutT (NUDIX family)